MPSIVLGLDPASTKNLGVCVLQFNGGSSNFKFKVLKRFTHVFDCTLQNKEKRLHDVRILVESILKEYRVDALATERIPGAGLPFVLCQMNELMGVIKMVSYENGLSLNEISPTTVKKQVTGSGRAEKRDVQTALLSLLDIESVTCFSSDHESDAAAVAVTHVLMNAVDKTKKKSKK